MWAVINHKNARVEYFKIPPYPDFLVLKLASFVFIAFYSWLFNVQLWVSPSSASIALKMVLRQKYEE